MAQTDTTGELSWLIAHPARRPSGPDGIRNGLSVPRRCSAMTASLPPQPGLRSTDRMFTVGQIANRLGLRKSAVHYYERRGLLPTVPRVGGQRRYTDQHVRRLAFLRLNCPYVQRDIDGRLNASLPSVTD